MSQLSLKLSLIAWQLLLHTLCNPSQGLLSQMADALLPCPFNIEVESQSQSHCLCVKVVVAQIGGLASVRISKLAHSKGGGLAIDAEQATRRMVHTQNLKQPETQPEGHAIMAPL